MGSCSLHCVGHRWSCSFHCVSHSGSCSLHCVGHRWSSSLHCVGHIEAAPYTVWAMVGVVHYTVWAIVGVAPYTVWAIGQLFHSFHTGSYSLHFLDQLGGAAFIPIVGHRGAAPYSVWGIGELLLTMCGLHGGSCSLQPVVLAMVRVVHYIVWAIVSCSVHCVNHREVAPYTVWAIGELLLTLCGP